MFLARRIVFFAVVLATSAGLVALLALVLAPGGWSPLKLLILVCFAGMAPWAGICLGNALPGFLLLALSADPARAVLPVAGDIDAAPIGHDIAIAVTIRNEAMDTVLPPLRRLLDGLHLAGAGNRFSLHILSDTQDPALIAAEDAAVAAFGANLIHLRRRDANTGFKAGNVMNFLDNNTGADLVLLLDADSEMSAQAVLRLARIMSADPAIGILQHLIVGRPAEASFPRLFQFGMRAGLRVWTTGQAWWQGPDGPYWGHNAMLRTAPFRAHCRLDPLPDGSAILSHDQVEAARMRAAGWKVCVWASEAGSTEANPPAMPEFLQRDTRWLAGNLQYRHLLLAPGFRLMGRFQLAQAMLMFVSALFWTALLALTALLAASVEAASPDGTLAWLVLGWALALHSPKLLGYAEVLASTRRARRYGGRTAYALGAATEIIFSLLLDPISQLHKAFAIVRLALGMRPGWAAQNRGVRAVGWVEATRMFWPHTLAGVAVFGLLALGSISACLWALPFAGGLLIAIPLCVLSSDRAVSARLRRVRLAASVEELADELPT